MSRERRHRTERHLGGLVAGATALLFGAGMIAWLWRRKRRTANQRIRISALGPRAETLATRLASCGVTVFPCFVDSDGASPGDVDATERGDLIIVDTTISDDALAALGHIAGRESVVLLDPLPSHLASTMSAWDEHSLLIACQVANPLAFWALPPGQIVPGPSLILGETDGSLSLRLRHAAAILGSAGHRAIVSRAIPGYVHLLWALRVVWYALLERNGSALRLIARDDERAFCRSVVAEVLLLHRAAGLPDSATRARLVTPQQPARSALAPMLALGTLCARGPQPRASDLSQAYAELIALGERYGFRTPLLSSLAPLFD